jgi:N-formylglutamate deformylase
MSDDATSDVELVRAFEACEPALGSLTHVEHLRVAWHYLQHEPLGCAGDRLRSGLQRFAASRGKPERYHETITWAYLVMLAECRHALGCVPFEAVEQHWPALIDHNSGALRSLYSEQQLSSPLAREVFLLPRRAGSSDAPR